MSFEQNIKSQVFSSIMPAFCRLLTLAFCLSVIAVAGHGQTFGLEQKFRQPVALPDAVYRKLLKNEDVADTIKQAKNEGKSTAFIKKQFFDVTRVNINNDGLPDLLVKAKSLLSGTNTTKYWIFKRTAKDYALVFETATFSLSILKNKSRGHRVIESAYPSGSKAVTTYFRFDGKRYVYSWSKESSL